MSFTLFFGNSQGTPVDATSNNSITYDFDWGSTPSYDGEYEVTFTFNSRQITSYLTTEYVIPVISWGALPSVFSPNSNNGSENSFALGVVRSVNNGTAGALFAEANSNVPIILRGKPTGNNFQIKLLGSNGALFGAIGTVGYAFSMHFRAVSLLPKEIRGSSQSFSLILNSRRGTASGGGALPDSILTFNTDWGNLSRHKGMFRLTSSFQTRLMASGVSFNALNRIDMNWGAVHYSYTPQKQTTDILAGTSNQTIAVIKGNPQIETKYGYKREQQVPIILSGLPSRNQFVVNIVTVGAGTSPGNFDGDWILTLFFEAI